ncbi:MAG: type II toxin-antitoxin system YafQ family toxin [Patescibacteria group bacterium]
MHRIHFSRASRKSLKKLLKSGRFPELLVAKVINDLASGKTLDPKYYNHQLEGEHASHFECHIKSDLLLIYEIDEKENKLTIIDIGSHSELFE